jgi:hypothetical protein
VWRPDERSAYYIVKSSARTNPAKTDWVEAMREQWKSYPEGTFERSQANIAAIFYNAAEKVMRVKKGDWWALRGVVNSVAHVTGREHPRLYRSLDEGPE